MDKEKISKFLKDYFLAMDNPPASELIVPADKIKFDKIRNYIGYATLIYIYGPTPPHEVKIEFDASNLDSSNFEVKYKYVQSY